MAIPAAEPRARCGGSPACPSSSSARVKSLDKLEALRPGACLVGQMLGMGDIVRVLVEVRPGGDGRGRSPAAQQEQLAPRGKFDLDDFRKQLRHHEENGLDARPDEQDSRPGPDGHGKPRRRGRRWRGEANRGDHRQHDPTAERRRNPELIDISRRRRIAAGSGVDPSDVSGLVKQFDQMAAVIKQLAQMSMMDKLRTLTGLGRVAATNPSALDHGPQDRNRQAATSKGRAAQKTKRKGGTPPPPRGTRPARVHPPANCRCRQDVLLIRYRD